MSTFELAQQTSAPTWLAGPNARAFIGVSGRMRDAENLLYKDAVKVRWPTTAPVDALNKLGADRGIERFPGESDASYRARLLDPFSAWYWSGTAKGIIDQLHAVGITDVAIQEDWSEAEPGDWYSRFWVVIGPTMPWQPLTMPFTLGPNTTLGSTATPGEVAAVKGIVKKWKSAHSVPVWIELAFPTASITWPMGRFQGYTQFTAPWVPGTYI